MHVFPLPHVSYDVQLLLSDSAEKGWGRQELAAAAGVAKMTVTRFFRGDHRTAKTAKKLADALGFPVRRYLVVPESRMADAEMKGTPSGVPSSSEDAGEASVNGGRRC